ncbi:hypothetical protein Tsubulata_028459, partial [Turnera subulata]
MYLLINRQRLKPTSPIAYRSGNYLCFQYITIVQYFCSVSSSSTIYLL